MARTGKDDRGKPDAPPVIEIAGHLYLVEEWSLDRKVGKAFTLRRLSPREAAQVRRWWAERDREVWARLIGGRDQKPS